MSRPTNTKLGKTKPVPIKLDDPLNERIEALAGKIGEPKSTVMRMCMRIGLDQLEKVYTEPKQMNDEPPKKKKNAA